MNVVTLDYVNWAIYFPELAVYVSPTQAQAYCVEACTLNQRATNYYTPGDRGYLLINLLTAHVAALRAPLGSPSSPLVGRISNATEGSVTVAAEFKVPDGCPQYYAQTKYGVEAWVLMAPDRTMRYVPPAPRRFGMRRW